MALSRRGILGLFTALPFVGKAELPAAVEAPVNLPPFEEMVRQTMHANAEKLVANVTRHNALLSRLKTKHSVMAELEYNEASTYARYTGYGAETA